MKTTLTIIICRSLLGAAVLTWAGTAFGQNGRAQPTPAPKSSVAQKEKNLEHTQNLKLHRASQLLKMRVQTSDGQRAGDIDNLAIEPESGKVVFVIVKPESKSDFGTQMRAVPFEALRIDRESQPMVLNVNAARYKDAPPFDPAGWGSTGDGKWSEIVYRHYGVTPHKIVVHETRGGAAPRALIKASDVLDMNIRDTDKRQLAEVQDLAIDSGQGVVRYAIIDSLGPKENAGKFMAIPFAALEVQDTDRTLVLDIERGQLRDAPTFTNLTDLTTPKYVERVLAFYEVPSDTVFGYVPPEEEADRPSRPGPAGAGTGGWDFRSNYNRKFNADSIETLRGTVNTIQRITPMSGMDPGVEMILKTEGGNTVVHLGPAWFINHQQLAFKEGDQVIVNAARAEMEGRTFYMALNVHRGDEVLYLRDRLGAPRWDATYKVNELVRPAPGERRGADIGEGDRD